MRYTKYFCTLALCDSITLVMTHKMKNVSQLRAPLRLNCN